MARLAAIVAIVFLSQAWIGAAGADTAKRRIDDKRVQISVATAVGAAATALARPDCQKLLTDFAAQDGRSLAEHLADVQRRAPDYLDLVWFLDGSREATCVRAEVYAFTQPGARSVYICGRMFESGTTLTTRRNVIIDEVLHSLGLGEDGKHPSSAAITHRVELRCGR